MDRTRSSNYDETVTLLEDKMTGAGSGIPPDDFRSGKQSGRMGNDELPTAIPAGSPLAGHRVCVLHKSVSATLTCRATGQRQVPADPPRDGRRRSASPPGGLDPGGHGQQEVIEEGTGGAPADHADPRPGIKSVSFARHGRLDSLPRRSIRGRYDIDANSSRACFRCPSAPDFSNASIATEIYFSASSVFPLVL